MKKLYGAAAIGAAFVLGFWLVAWFPASRSRTRRAHAVFELRTYTAPDGKLADLHARFRNHTMRIFKKHGIENITYFAPQDAPLSRRTRSIYLIATPAVRPPSRTGRHFQKDPEWQKVANESQVNGKIVAKVESVFLDATDYSPMK